LDFYVESISDLELILNGFLGLNFGYVKPESVYLCRSNLQFQKELKVVKKCKTWLSNPNPVKQNL